MASGNIVARWQAQDGIPPLTSFAALTRRNNHFVAAFDAAAAESLDFADVLDRAYSGGGLTLVIGWMSASATSGAVKWNAQIERHQASTDDLDADSLATAQTATSTTAGTSGQLVYTTITFTSGANMDSLAVGEDYRLRITRDATNGADTMSGDCQLKSLELRES
jgi:hypothetical protein